DDALIGQLGVSPVNRSHAVDFDEYVLAEAADVEIVPVRVLVLRRGLGPGLDREGLQVRLRDQAAGRIRETCRVDLTLGTDDGTLDTVVDLRAKLHAAVARAIGALDLESKVKIAIRLIANEERVGRFARRRTADYRAVFGVPVAFEAVPAGQIAFVEKGILF